MKALKYLQGGLLALVVFFLAFWIFAPWQRIGLYTLDAVRLLCAKNGIFMNYENFESEGVLAPVYKMEDFDIEMPVAKLSMSDVAVKILPMESLLSGGISCRVSFGKSEVSMIPQNRIQLTHGDVKLAATARTIAASEADIAGELQVTGDAAYDRADGKILQSTLLVKVPENINALLSSPLLSRYIESAGNGEWRIKQNAPPKE